MHRHTRQIINPTNTKLPPQLLLQGKRHIRNILLRRILGLIFGEKERALEGDGEGFVEFFDVFGDVLWATDAFAFEFGVDGFEEG